MTGGSGAHYTQAPSIINRDPPFPAGCRATVLVWDNRSG